MPADQAQCQAPRTARQCGQIRPHQRHPDRGHLRHLCGRPKVGYKIQAVQARTIPAPVARITTTPLYNWPDVAKWLYRPHRLQKDAVVEALAMKASNTILGVPDFGRALKERLKAEESRLENANV